MNIKIPQPSASQEEIETPSPQTGSGQSDTKEILLLASGLLVLVFGIGGLLMYSEEEPLPATASQGIDRAQMAHAFASTKPQLPGSDPMALRQGPAEEPLTDAITPITEPGGNQSQDETDVYFAFNKWTLSDEAKEKINTRMENRPEGWNGTLRIVGHTDAQGTDAYNKALGLKRAESVKTYLVSLGIPEADVQVETLGKDGPVCQEETPECFEQNRRAQVAFLPSSTPIGEEIQLSMNPVSLDAAASEESVPSSDESPNVPSEIEGTSQEDIQKESLTADQPVTVGSLP